MQFRLHVYGGLHLLDCAIVVAGLCQLRAEQVTLFGFSGRGHEWASLADLSVSAINAPGLVPDADDQGVDVRRLKLLAQPVELVQLVDGPDSHTMPDIRVH